MKTLRRMTARLNQMTDTTYTFLRGSLLISCTMALCALVLFIVGEPSVSGYEAYKCAQELVALGAVTLLIATIGSVCVEEVTMKGDAKPPRK